MSTNYLALPIGSSAPEIVNAVIEIPMGSSNKYEYDKRLHVFRLDRSLYSPVHYPGDYGFIPSTLAEDGDALDILVLDEVGTFSGCLVEVRPIGQLELRDEGTPDEKILAVATQNPRYANVHDYADIYPHLLLEIRHFFSVYKDLEGKNIEIVGWQGVERARQHIVACHRRYAAENRT